MLNRVFSELCRAPVELSHRSFNKGGPEVAWYDRQPSRSRTIRVEHEFAASANGRSSPPGNGAVARALFDPLMNRVPRLCNKGRAMWENRTIAARPVRDIVDRRRTGTHANELHKNNRREWPGCSTHPWPRAQAGVRRVKRPDRSWQTQHGPRPWSSSASGSLKSFDCVSWSSCRGQHRGLGRATRRWPGAHGRLPNTRPRSRTDLALAVTPHFVTPIDSARETSRAER